MKIRGDEFDGQTKIKNGLFMKERADKVDE